MTVPPVQYVTTGDGYRIAYTVAGDGPPLVCMPSPLNHLRLQWKASGTFHFLYEYLMATYKLVCYDSRGQGMSTRGLGEDFRIENFETDLEAVVDAENLDRFVLLGPHGWGRVAVRYAEHHPERLFGLILWNANTGDASMDTRYNPSHFADLARDDWDAFVETIGRITWASEDPILATTFVREATTQEDWLRRAEAWKRYNIADSLPSIRVPTLVMSPTSDHYPMARAETGVQIAARIPGARLEIYNDPGGLLSHGTEEPPAVALINDFVKGLDLPVPAKQAST
jgi:pimeloyl-ACP methyl ester carboxylesterase